MKRRGNVTLMKDDNFTHNIGWKVRREETTWKMRE